MEPHVAASPRHAARARARAGRGGLSRLKQPQPAGRRVILTPPLPGQWRWCSAAPARKPTTAGALEEGVHLCRVQDITNLATSLRSRAVRRGLGLSSPASWSRGHAHPLRAPPAPSLDWPRGTSTAATRPWTAWGSWLLLHGAKGAGEWTLSARAGTSLPVGRTEPNPSALGREGLPHEHIRFGTGTGIQCWPGRRPSLRRQQLELSTLGRFRSPPTSTATRRQPRPGRARATRKLAPKWFAGAGAATRAARRRDLGRPHRGGRQPGATTCCWRWRSRAAREGRPDAGRPDPDVTRATAPSSTTR